MIRVKSVDIIIKEKPEGEIIDESFIKGIYFLGMKLYERHIRYKATLGDKPKNTGFK